LRCRTVTNERGGKLKILKKVCDEEICGTQECKKRGKEKAAKFGERKGD